jgi:hypothetical protein
VSKRKQEPNFLESLEGNFNGCPFESHEASMAIMFIFVEIITRKYRYISKDINEYMMIFGDVKICR